MNQQPKYVLFAGGGLRLNDNVFDFEAGEIAKLAESEQIEYDDAVRRYFAEERETYCAAVPIEKPQLEPGKLLEDLTHRYCEGIDPEDGSLDGIAFSPETRKLLAEINGRIREEFPPLWKEGDRLDPENVVSLFFDWEACYHEKAMRFSAVDDSFRRAFLFVARASSGKRHSCFRYVRIDATKQPGNDRVKLTGISPSMMIECSVGASPNVVVPGTVFVPADFGRKLLDGWEGIDITIEGTEDGNVVLAEEGFQVKLSPNGITKEDWKGIEATFDFPPTLTVPRHVLETAVKRIDRAIDNTNAKYALGGILLDIRRSGCAFVTTDGRRLHVQQFVPGTISAEFDGNGETDSPIIPVDALRAAAAMKGREIVISTTPRHIEFLGKDCRVVAELLEGRFPNWRKIIPKHKQVCTVLVGPFLELIRAAPAIMEDSSSNALRLTFKKGALTAEGCHSEIGSFSSSIEIDYDGEEKTIRLDYRFLLSILEPLLYTDCLSIRLGDADESGDWPAHLFVLPGVHGAIGDFTAVVMPLH